MLISGFFLVQKIGKVNASPYVSQFTKAVTDIVTYLENSQKTAPRPQSQNPQSVKEPLPQVTFKNLPTSKTTPKVTSQSRTTVNINGKTIYDSQDQNEQPTVKNNKTNSCYQFTVPHLDGSSSNLCYNQSDYNQLVSLYSQYTSAQANYKFELRVADMYVDSDHFKHLSDEAKRKAQEWKDKMGQIALQMYNIEKKGW